MKVINLFGGPGSGKSTTAAGLFYKMKLQHRSVELVTEYAKSLLYSKRLDNMLDQQEYIFAKQNSMLHRLRDRVDFVITDSPILLSNVYVSDEWACVRPFKELVTLSFNTYNNINIVLNRPPTFEKEGRRHNEEQSVVIDTQIIEMFKGVHTPYDVFDCNDTVVDDILNSGLLD